MLRYIYADDLPNFPKLHATMFTDRATQFCTRLGWDLHLDEKGEERDEYDALNPLYVIWEMPDGRHGGSMRFLPTTGRTMAQEHFLHLTDGKPMQSSAIWECTRFCLGAGAGPRVSTALMLGGAEVGRHFGLSHALGVFDARMVHIYRRLGWGPIILGAQGQGRAAISLGLWEFSAQIRARLLKNAGISNEVSRRWADRAFGAKEMLCSVG